MMINKIIEIFMVIDGISNKIEEAYRGITEKIPNYIKEHIDFKEKYIVIVATIVMLIVLLIISQITKSYEIELTLIVMGAGIIIATILIIVLYKTMTSVRWFMLFAAAMSLTTASALNAIIPAKYSIIIKPYMIYSMLCILMSIIAKPEVAKMSNEIMGTIATFGYTVMMHYKDKIAMEITCFTIRHTIMTEFIKTIFQIDKTITEESQIAELASSFLVVIFISVVSIMLIHTREYIEEKYKEKYIEKYEAMQAKYQSTK